MEEKQEKKYISEKIIDNVAKFCINKKKSNKFSHYRDLIGRIKTQTPWMLQILPYVYFTLV